MFPSAEDVRRNAKVALILRAGRGRSNPAPGRQVVSYEGAKKYGLPIGATIAPGGRPLSALQQEALGRLSREELGRYHAARLSGATHTAALARVRPPVKAAPRGILSPSRSTFIVAAAGTNPPHRSSFPDDEPTFAYLRKQGYVKVQGDRIVATDKGVGYLERVHPTQVPEGARERLTAPVPAKKATPRAVKAAPATTTGPRVDPLEGNTFNVIESDGGWKVVEHVPGGTDRTYRDNATREAFPTRAAAEAHIDRIFEDRARLKQTLGFDGLLGDGPAAVKHKQTRQVLEQMEAHGWVLRAPTMAGAFIDGATYEAPDGRTITLHLPLGNAKNPSFSTGEGRGYRSLTYRAALTHVVTPIPPKAPDAPTVHYAARNLKLPGFDFGAPVYHEFDRVAPSLREPLQKAQRDIQSHGFTTAAVSEAGAGLRSRADLLEQVNAPDSAAHAATLRKVADELDRLAAVRDAHEREVAARATAPLDIRPAKVRGAGGAMSDYQRALTQYGLSPRDASAYAAYVQRHPGATVEQWRAQRAQPST